MSIFCGLRRLMCDGRRCSETVTDEFSSDEEARRIMRDHGWALLITVDGEELDLCPKCRAERERL